MKYLNYRRGQLDEIDLEIVAAFFENARLPMSELAGRVGLSAPSVIERVRRLEDAGVIASYQACINPATVGLPVSAYIRIRPMPGLLRKVAELLPKIEEISEADRITGEDCFIAKVHVAALKDLEAVIDRIIPYAITSTSIIQSAPVPRRLPIVKIAKNSRPRRPKKNSRLSADVAPVAPH